MEHPGGSIQVCCDWSVWETGTQNRNIINPLRGSLVNKNLHDPSEVYPTAGKGVYLS